MVNIHPNTPYVAKIESTPVMGVEIRKERVAPLLAPLFLMLVAKGITPQEQTGRGMPKMVDFITDKILLSPRCLVTIVSGTISCKIPAKSSPNRIYGAIALLKSSSAFKNSVISSISIILICSYIQLMINLCH